MADDGKFLTRPDNAAPLFDSKSGKAAALKRWERTNKEKQATQQTLLIKHAADKLRIDVSEMTYEEALYSVLVNPMLIEASKGKTAAGKLALTLLGEMPDFADAKVVNTKQELNVYNLTLTPKEALAYIEKDRPDKVIEVIRAQLDENLETIIVEVPLD